MCGICGLINKDGNNVEVTKISRMCGSMVHRGPDDEGVFAFESFGIGMRRLKIIDLNTGNQPIHNEDNTIWVVFNGEIYNYLELRETLLSLGHIFYTKSDTETIIHLYEEYGKNCVDHLNGMFCFAIVDTIKKEMFIARDRLGIKQLYYYEDDSIFIFGSEIKVILNELDTKQSINYKSIDDYFSFLYIPQDRTAFAKIKKLSPAFWLHSKDNKTTQCRYWKTNYTSTKWSEQEAIEITDGKIRTAIERQMISDVPLGAYLSGGVDSSIIVAMMSSMISKPVETFSIIWDKSSVAYDEREYARIVSDLYKTNHHEFLVKPDVEEVIGNIINGFDEPFADASAIPNYYIAKETRKFVTVALSGLGGDEIAGGYERYLGMKVMGFYNKMPGIFRSSLKTFIQKMPDSKKGSNTNERLKKFAQSSEYDFVNRYYNVITTLTDSEKYNLYSQKLKSHLDGCSKPVDCFQTLFTECNSNDPLNKQLYIDQNTYLVDELLVLSDRMSMAHSLELRVPYLDHTLVEHFAQMNTNLKLHNFSKKYILKKIAEKYLPKKIIYRRKKGFSVPLVLWFRNELKSYMNHILNEKSINKTGLFNYSEVKNIVDQHVGGMRNNDEKIWALMVFLLWYDKFIEKIF